MTRSSGVGIDDPVRRAPGRLVTRPLQVQIDLPRAGGEDLDRQNGYPGKVLVREVRLVRDEQVRLQDRVPCSPSSPHSVDARELEDRALGAFGVPVQVVHSGVPALDPVVMSKELSRPLLLPEVRSAFAAE